MSNFKKTGYTAKTPENFVIDAAVIYLDVEFDGTDFKGTPLGATAGGVSINIEHTYRKEEVDGTYYTPVKGLNFLESSICTITANLKELTAENLRRAINGTLEDAEADEAPEGYQVIKPKRYIEDGDYIKNVAIVGTHNGTGKQVIFWLSNGLVTSPLTLATEDNQAVVVEQSIVAHATAEQLLADEFPWKIYFPITEEA